MERIIRIKNVGAKNLSPHVFPVVLYVRRLYKYFSRFLEVIQWSYEGIKG